MKTIYLGGGCFWCTEAAFKSLRGVTEVVSGYMGGHVANPSYEAVCSGTTGHAEVVRVAYDDTIISTSDLLDVFFDIHDPTTLNQQGNDIGTQYRSIIFYTPDQDPTVRTDQDGVDHLGEIEEAINRKNATLPEGSHVVTQVAAATEFYPAEPYHHDYYSAHITAPYCRVVISPKLEKLRAHFGDKLVS